MVFLNRDTENKIMKRIGQYQKDNASTFLKCYREDLLDANKSLRAYKKINATSGIAIYKNRVAGLKDAIAQLREFV
jgi:hypothetical protein